MKYFILYLFPLLVGLASCATPHPVVDPIPEHDHFTLASTHVGEVRTINVWMPPGYLNGSDAFPVLYMLDGGIKEDFPHIANTLADLIAAQKIPPVILVGMENTQRRRDLTGPTQVEKDKSIAPVVGGSTQFRAFIQEELFPAIQKKYRTDGRKGIIGESLAGLFVTETFLQSPDMFDFYMAFDPSLWWNDRNLLQTSREALGRFPTNPKTFWFAGSGAKDIFEATGQLAGILETQKLNTLTWRYSPEPKEKHHTIFRATKEKALVWTLTNALR